MPRQRRPDTNPKIFAAGLPELSDDQVVAMAALARSSNRPGIQGQRIRGALNAEVRRRGLGRQLASFGDSGAGERDTAGERTMGVETDADFAIFVEHIKTYSDGALVAAAVVTLATRPAGPFGQRTHDALWAEVERRGMGEFVDDLVAAAKEQGRAMVDDGESGGD